MDINRSEICLGVLQTANATLWKINEILEQYSDVGGVRTRRLFPLADLVVNSSETVMIQSATFRLAKIITETKTSDQRIGAILAALASDFKRSNDPLMKFAEEPYIGGDRKKIEVFRKRDSGVFHEQHPLDKLFRNVDDVEKIFHNMETQWMKNLLNNSVGKNIEKVHRGLEPLKECSSSLKNVSIVFNNIFVKNRFDSLLTIYKLLESMEKVEQWFSIAKADGKFDVPKKLYDPFLKCFATAPSIPANEAHTYKKSIEYHEYAKKVFDDLKQFLELTDQININVFSSAVKSQINSIQKFLSAIANENDKDKIRKEMEKMYIDFEMSESETNVYLMSMMVEEQIKPLQKLFKSKFIEHIRENPNPNDIVRLVDILSASGIFPLMDCYTKHQKTYETLSTIIDGTNSLLYVYQNNHAVNTTLVFLEEVSVAQKGLKETMKLIAGWGSAGGINEEASIMINFGKGHDVVSRLFNGIQTLKDMTSFPKKEIMIDAINRSEVLHDVDVHEYNFAKRWSRNQNYQNGENGLKGISEVFEQSSKVKGVAFDWQDFEPFRVLAARKYSRLLGNLLVLKEDSKELDFAKRSGTLKSAASGVTTLREFLENMEHAQFLAFSQQPKFPILTVVWITGLALLVILLLLVIGFCLSPYGRKRCTKFYLRQWGSKEDIEQCWRYAFWTDQESERNMLCEAVREINYDHVKALVEKGAYINAYNSFGNTPLHASTKYGHVKIVELLLKNGADRMAYNTENMTPEQLNDNNLGKSTTTTTTNTTMASSKSSVHTEKPDSSTCAEIEKLYKKYMNKSFKPRIPDLLPTMAYHIKIDDKIKKKSAVTFTEKFKGIVTDELTEVTHLIVHTDTDGILNSHDFSYIVCVFLPTIIMQEQWMNACLEKQSNLRDDYKWRVTKVRYQGKVYGTVVAWARWLHKQCIPYLWGVQIYISNEAHADEMVRRQLKQVVEMHGATWCDKVQVKEQYNAGSHPFHHFDKGPLFIIHGKKEDKYDNLKKDRMYSVMTFYEFVDFMLAMKVTYDPERRLPVPVKNED
uniref:ANK_REP_REGION domain-containing protein n=1 Tax=Caenorhabditis japonica TaxID=281687 RepID=A0A8R1DN51_CAEJA